jgi:flagellar assembly protein FliH
MSTSPKLAPATSSSGARTPYESEAAPSVHPFPYDVIAPSTVRRLAIVQAAAEGLGVSGTSATNSEDEAAAREAQARAQGVQQGQTEARKSFEEQLARERAGVTTALAQFTRDRATYFEKAEGEVVQLALSIARKILYREAQIDPLLLAGIVRVALEKIDGATGVRLRVHPQNAADWRRYLTAHLDSADLPEIIEDSSQPLDRCTLETSMGTATVGLEVQLKEIEQGLMDLLAARPESVKQES